MRDDLDALGERSLQIRVCPTDVCTLITSNVAATTIR